MKIFSTKVHGYLDYLVSIVLLVAPTLLNLDADSIEGMVFYIPGGTLLFYSLLTNYELGLIKVLPMKAHLTLDIFSGIFLTASPWIFGFEKQIFIPYVILGVAEIVAGSTTTSRVGVPEMQEIIATEVIKPRIVKGKASTADTKARTPHLEKQTTEARKPVPSSKETPSSIKKTPPPPKKMVSDIKKPNTVSNKKPNVKK